MNTAAGTAEAETEIPADMAEATTVTTAEKAETGTITAEKKAERTMNRAEEGPSAFRSSADRKKAWCGQEIHLLCG